MSTAWRLTALVSTSLLLLAAVCHGASFDYRSSPIHGHVVSDGHSAVAGVMILAFWSGGPEVPILNVGTLHVEEVATNATGQFTLPAWTATELRSPVRAPRPRLYAYAPGYEWLFVDFERSTASPLEVRLSPFRGDESRWAEQFNQLIGQLVLVAAPLPGSPRPFRMVEAVEREWQRLPSELRRPPSVLQAFGPAVEEARAAYADWALREKERK